MIESDGKSLKVNHDHTVHRPGEQGKRKTSHLKVNSKSDIVKIAKSEEHPKSSNSFAVNTAAAESNPNNLMGLNYNSASAHQLQSIPGIGPKLSQRILDYRSENGPFKSVEDLINVKGIGPSKMNAIRQYGYVVEPQAP